MFNFAKFMTIGIEHVRPFWDAFRNGLLHRAMIKGSVDYRLTGEHPGRPDQVADGKVYIYVWDFRDVVVKKLKLYHRELWGVKIAPIPNIYFRECTRRDFHTRAGHWVCFVLFKVVGTRGSTRWGGGHWAAKGLQWPSLVAATLLRWLQAALARRAQSLSLNG
jgi:hypothetical protein